MSLSNLYLEIAASSSHPSEMGICALHRWHGDSWSHAGAPAALLGPSVPSLWLLLISQDPESQARSSLACRRWQSSGLHTNKELVSRKKGKQNWSRQLTAPQHFNRRYLPGLFSQGRVWRWLEVILPCELSPYIVKDSDRKWTRAMCSGILCIL